MKCCVALTVFLVFALAGCGQKHVVTQPDLPPLAPPPPPERVVVPAEPDDAGRGGTTETTNPSGTGKSSPEKPGNRVRTPPADTAKPAEIPQPAVPAGAVVEPPPKQLLQTAETALQEKELNGLLEQADGNLGKVDRKLLNADAKQQYDTALGFIRQARLAQKEKNFGLAVRLAKNAVTILSALANR